MNDPRRAEVWGKKPEIADRTLNERKYCKVCDYYYSEMFTCPICYGGALERERIRVKILERVLELKQCHKKDDCKETARLIESYIPEWLDGE